LADRARGAIGLSHLLSPQRHDRHDVRGADPRVSTDVCAQVNPLLRDADRGE